MTTGEPQKTTLPTTGGKGGRGSAKPFPVGTFEDTLVLAGAIHQHGIDGQIRRAIVFDKMSKSPDSGSGRQLVINSAKYKLTSGGYQAEYLNLTDDGKGIVSPDATPAERRRKEFELAIKQIDVFNRLYDRLKTKRLPSMDVMLDEVGNLGISAADRAVCAEIFLANVKYLGLVKELSGVERLISIEAALENLPARVEKGGKPLGTPDASGERDVERNRTGDVAAPTVHVDVQIHIDSSASPEQIDQIFASMARHLYPNRAT